MRPPAAPADAIVLPGVLEALATTKAMIGRSVASLSAADPGLFGPGTVSWRVFSHASYGASGVAAALVQALHPVAMAAVDRHSAFRRDAWRRAHMTADYVFTITFSARPVAEAAARKVRAIHSKLSGTEPATGRFYRADDPDLLLWIHCVHTDYALRGYDAFASRLTPAEADDFVREQVVAARLVGLDGERVPRSRAELLAFLSSVEGLRATGPALRFSRMLLDARMPLTMRPFWALHVAAAAALLPDDVRRTYALPRWLPRGRLARALMRAAFRAMNSGYLLFRPVRRARARLRQIERDLAHAPEPR
jgi:uncharacterized protein (DUF2236 family)